MNNKPTTNNISLGIRTKTFTIDDDPNRVIELDPSDMGVIGRLDEAIPKIDAVMNEFVEAGKKMSEDGGAGFGALLKDFDTRMREIVNTVFDYDVCTVCVPKGTLLDVVSDSDKFKFEVIIESLSKVYEDTIIGDLTRVKNRMNEHTKKYTTTKKPIKKTK